MATTRTKKTAGASKSTAPKAAPKAAAKPAPAKSTELDKLTKRVADLEKQLVELKAAPAPVDGGLRAELINLRSQFQKVVAVLHENNDSRVIAKLIGRIFQ